MYNQLTQYIGLGATQAQINTLGPNYGLNNDSTSQAYRGYNYDKIHNDFEYVGVKTVLDSGWTIDNKAYTYAYYHDGFNGEDPNGETPNGTAYSATDVPGQALVNYYRSWGDTFRLTKSLPFGQIEAGVWGDHQANTRRLTEEDFTLGQAYNPVNIGTATLGVDRALDQTLTTVEPFLQVDWKALPGLTLSPGVRYDYFSRHVDAEVDVKSGLPETYTNTYGSVLPSFLAHYEFSPNWTAYAQVAKGFLAPNENFFNRGTGANLSQTTLQPQQTWNYQLGSNWQSQRLSLGADIYYIDFNNLIVPNTSGGITTYSNLGGATYRGFEAESTVYLGSGFSVYANGSVNSSNDKSSDTPLPGAPTGTAAFGVIYNLNGWYVSLLDKWVGDLYGDTGRSIPIRNYSILNGALNYTFEGNLFGSSKPSIKLSFNNLLDSTRIYALAGYTVAANTPLYWTIPGRSVFAVLTVPF
jgi:iron complex outermembrane receptor protein